MKLLNKKKLKPNLKRETIFETEARLKNEAQELAKQNQDKKPTKYLLKR